MQFQLSANPPDAVAIANVLKPLDPLVKITLDPEHGLLEVISTISSNKIVHALDQIDCGAQPMEKLEHISGGTTCCGGCS